MEVSIYDYHLPPERIAQKPLSNRTNSKLMVMDRETGSILHAHVKELLNFLRPGDALVLNDSRVRPARLIGEKIDTKARIELLILKPLGNQEWEALVKPSKRIKPGTQVQIGDGMLNATAQRKSTVDGGWVFQFDQPDSMMEEWFDKWGEMPLPPYISEKLDDPDRYQTVYASRVGSAAAPTAGLHFTEELLSALKDYGVELVYLTLHVGLGTFRPMAVEKIEDHQMHAEYFELSEEAAEKINRVKSQGGRVIPVGTTSIRTLESIALQNDGKVVASQGWTDLFIYPGFSFQVASGLFTNFHLPKSTLLMLVSAFSSRDNVIHAYQEAIHYQYRFFSFGDAMLILGDS